MNRYLNHIGIAITSLLLMGCNKFMEEQSQDLAYAGTWQKLDEVMAGEVYMKHYITSPTSSFRNESAAAYFPWLNGMDDDITEFVSGPSGLDNRSDIFGFYTWQANPFVSNTFIPNNDDSWSKVYKCINAANIVIHQTDLLKDDPEQLRRIKGEALFLRAFYYFYMVNVYAPAYNKASAATDPGVPLKITEYVEDRFFTRSTVDSVYRQMQADLNLAEQCLDNVPQRSLYHANVNAVNLLQSRVYLYMEDWGQAVGAADKVIGRQPQLVNLNTYEPHTSFFSAQSPEAIFTQGGNAMAYLMGEGVAQSFQPSTALMNLFTANDKRQTSFFETDQLGKKRYTKMYRSTVNKVLPTEIFSDNYFLRNAEAYLNKAEAEAMLGNEADANITLNILRESRFAPEDFVPANYAGQQLVSFIRDERRRELCFEGHRWFDLKRYAVNEAYPYTTTIVHPYSEAPPGGTPFLRATLTLLPGDPAYLIPIPLNAVVFNQGVLVQNPERPDRTF